MRWQRVLGALVPVVLVAMLAACTGTGSSPVTAPTVARGVLASALGMAYLGAKGLTTTAMASVLHLPAQSRDALLAGLAARLAALRAANGAGVTLAASDFVWADPALPPLKSYLDDVATGYDAGVGEAPFQTDPQRAASQVNQAISRDTRGQIPQLVTPGMVANVGWVLTAALYMDARWAAPFDPAQTEAGTFTTAGGKPVTVQYMHSPQPVAAGGADGWTGAWLSYQGGKLGMLAILPPAGAGSCAVPSAGGLAALRKAVLTNQGPGAMIGLPKLDISSNASMDGELKALGMARAFGPLADFTGMSPTAASIGFVQQAATLKVDEKGTVGAAAAAVGVLPAAGFAGRERRMLATAHLKPPSTSAVNCRRGTPNRRRAAPWSKITAHAVPSMSSCHAQDTGSRATGGSPAKASLSCCEWNRTCRSSSARIRRATSAASGGTAPSRHAW
jgi:serine protease inhibitor